jgi:hypothetical protein
LSFFPLNKLHPRLIFKKLESSSEKSSHYFRIDADSGDISIADDLTQELFDEYKVRPNDTSAQGDQMSLQRSRPKSRPIHFWQN